MRHGGCMEEEEVQSAVRMIKRGEISV